jgi:hypothetical protein
MAKRSMSEGVSDLLISCHSTLANQAANGTL